MEETKKYLYSYAKDRYLWEHSRKNELNSSVTIPLGILTLQITSFSYFLLNFPREICGRIFIAFIVFLILSVISIILSVILFLRHQSGYKYAYILSPKDMENYRNSYISAYTDNNDNIDYDYIYNELKETELSEYIEATETNILNNETKIKFYRHFLLSLIISTALLVLTLLFSLLLDKNIELIRVFIEQSIE
jgi:ABC-type multidrug transport system fused ATPase/permease subunit